MLTNESTTPTATATAAIAPTATAVRCLSPREQLARRVLARDQLTRREPAQLTPSPSRSGSDLPAVAIAFSTMSQTAASGGPAIGVGGVAIPIAISWVNLLVLSRTVGRRRAGCRIAPA
jgi:hypothetical protein